MRRSLGLATVLVVLSLMFPLAASAGPQWARMPPGTVFLDAPAGLVCPAAIGEVTWTYLGGNHAIVAKPDGRVMMAMGTARYEVASLATGKSVVLSSTGALSVSPSGNGGVLMHASGMGVWGFYPGDAGPGDQTAGRSFYFVGTQTALNTANGATIDFSYSGKIVMDVCAAIS